MIKNILHTAYAREPDNIRWLYVVSALRQAEQVHVRAASEMQHGYSSFPRRPRVDFTDRGFNNNGASSSGRVPDQRIVPSYHNCGSEDHFHNTAQCRVGLSKAVALAVDVLDDVVEVVEVGGRTAL